MTAVIIPVKPFGIAKARLSSVLDRRSRARLGRAVAEHTIRQAQSTDAEVVVVTPDDDVAAWAHGRGCNVITEPAGAGLNRAAAVAVGVRTDPWVVLHADLPLLRTKDVAMLVDLAAAGWCLAPAHDGGTSAVGGRGEFAFSYGPGSFARHLATIAGPVAIVSRIGLAVDLDDAHDLTVIQHHPDGAWIERYLG